MSPKASGGRHLVAVVDERLTRRPFEIGPGWLGPDVQVVAPDVLDPGTPSSILEEATIILTAHAPVDERMIDLSPRLQLIAKPGTGVDNIDVETAVSRGVLVSNVPGLRARAVAEHALYLALAVARRSWAMSTSSEFFEGEALQLEGRRMGILGLGEIGSTLAGIASGFGMSVMAHSRTRRSVEGVTLAPLDQVFEMSDVVVGCLPASAETHHLINQRRMRSMPATGIVVNVGRGTTLDTVGLLRNLSDGWLAGVGLDVTDPEPLPLDHPLRQYERVLITPHIGGHSDIAQRSVLERFRGNVEAVLDGLLPHDLVAG